MDILVPLAIPFIALICFVGIVENFVELVDRIFRKLHPDSKHVGVVFSWIIIVMLSYLIAMLGNFRFFNYLNVFFIYDWLDWLFSAAMIGAGSSAMEKKFNLMGKIPMGISSIASVIRSKEPTPPPVQKSYIEVNTEEEDNAYSVPREKSEEPVYTPNKHPTI